MHSDHLESVLDDGTGCLGSVASSKPGVCIQCDTEADRRVVPVVVIDHHFADVGPARIKDDGPVGTPVGGCKPRQPCLDLRPGELRVGSGEAH